MLDLAARVLLHFGRVLADCAVLAAFGLEEPRDGEDERGHGAPNCTVRCGIGYAMALQELGDADDCERSHEDSKKALYPESSAQGIPLVRSNAEVKRRRSRPP